MGVFYIKVFISGLLTAAVFTYFARKIILKLNIVDYPDEGRKIHKAKVPLLGGLGIFCAFFVFLYLFRGVLLSGSLISSHWLGFFAGGIVLMIGGFLDDKYNLRAKYQIIFPLLASVCVVIGGVQIEKITNPFGGYFFLNQWQIPIFKLGENVLSFSLISGLLIIFWLLGMMYTTKLLDGIDGLVSGLTAIGGLIIFLFTITTKYYQPDIGLAALVLAASAAGFLIFNWHPAKIFLGEGGSLFMGYALGVLAIISGGKIAIALLVMGIPVLDLIWTIIRRLAAGVNPFKIADRRHLHHRLYCLGIGQRRTALIFYALAAIFGLSGLFLQSLGKIYLLIALLLLMFFLIVIFNYLDRKYGK